MQRCAFHPWHEFHQTCVADIEDQAVNDLITEVPVCHLAALEAQRCLYLIAFTKEAYCLVFLRLVVVLVYRHGELDLFDDNDLLLLARCALALVFLVEKLAVILDLADWRDCVGRDFYEIERAFPSHFKGVERRHDSELLPILVNHADFACADAFVGADERLGGTFIYWWNKSPPQRPIGLAMRVGWISVTQKKLRRNEEYITYRRISSSRRAYSWKEEETVIPSASVTYGYDGSSRLLLDCCGHVSDVSRDEYSRHKRRIE